MDSGWYAATSLVRGVERVSTVTEDGSSFTMKQSSTLGSVAPRVKGFLASNLPYAAGLVVVGMPVSSRGR